MNALVGLRRSFTATIVGDCVRSAQDRLMTCSIAGVICDLQSIGSPIIACNDRFYHLSGYEPYEVLGQNCRFLNRGKLTKSEANSFHQAIAFGTECDVEVINYRKDGSSFLNGVSLTPIYTSSGKLVAMVGLLIDLSGFDPTLRLQEFHRARVKMTALSRRQKQVAIAMANGKQNKEISYDLGISERTVKLHRQEMLRNLGVANSIEAVRIVVSAGY